MKARAFGVGLAVCIVGSNVAHAETWVGHQKYLSGGSGCVNARTYDYMYTWDPSTRTFTVANENTSSSKLATVKLPAGNDVVNERFKSPSGVRFHIIGSVVTKDLVLEATDFGCKWTTPSK